MGALIVFWLLCGVVTAVIAANKGKSVVGWFFLGCILGIFGVILVAVLPAEQPTAVRIVNEWPDRRADASWERRISASTPAMASTHTISEPAKAVPYDAKRWSVLKEVDLDIGSAASRMAALGPRFEHQLAEKFLALNDKSYLDAIERKLLDAAQVEREEVEKRLAGRHDAEAIASAQEVQAYNKLFAANGGRDPRENVTVVNVEPYFGSWMAYRGGAKVTFENGVVTLHRKGMMRRFDSDPDPI